MARVTSILFKGMKGKIGNVVFKNRNGETYACKAPEYNKNRKLHASEIDAREKFTIRTQMAKQLLNTPGTGEIYRAAAVGKSPYALVIRDISSAPEVLNITGQEYDGIPGQKIFIEAVDDFKVKSVRVVITDASNTLIEQGEAVLRDHHSIWIYTVQQLNRKVDGCLIRAIAEDIPGNKGELEVIVSRENSL